MGVSCLEAQLEHSCMASIMASFEAILARLRTFNFSLEGFARLSGRRYQVSKKDKVGGLEGWSLAAPLWP